MKRFLVLFFLLGGAGLVLAEEPLKITFFVRGGDTNAANAAASPVLAEVDRLTGTSLEFRWLADPAFSDELALGVANNNLPMVIALDKNSLFLKAVKEDRFWNLGPYLKDYPHLATINPVILENAKVDGVLYGLPKTRPLGRNALVFRQDWFDSLRLKKLETIDDFKAMLQAFTQRDPDKNRKKDTYGMVLTSYRGSLEQIAVWFGAPNAWGEVSGELVPSFLTPEFRNSLRFLRDCYAEGLINLDFPAQDPADWNQFVSEGKAGVIVDITGRGPGIVKAAKAAGQTVEMNIQGAVAGPLGYRVMATDGFAGLIAVTKSGVKDEATLKKVLSLLDWMSSDAGRDLLLNGVEGTDWKRADSGITKLKYEGQKLAGPDIAQTMVFPSSPAATVLATDTGSKIRTEAAVQADNEKSLVTNPAVGLTSDNQGKRGGYLQDLMDDARIRFILGLIDEAGYDQAIAFWKSQGGELLIQQINASYQKSRS